MELFEYQKEILKEMGDKERVACYTGCGTGKTIMGSTKLISFNCPYNLIICQKSKVKDWTEHMWFEHGIRAKLMPTPNSEFTPGYTIITYGQVSNRHAVLNFRGKMALLLDESSKIQNERTEQYAKGVKKLSPKYVVLLSGTPVTGDKFDRMYTQAKLLGSKLSKKAFLDRFIEYDLVERPGSYMKYYQCYGCKDIQGLHDYMTSLGAIFKKTEDLIDLPPQQEIMHYVPKSKKYGYFSKDWVVDRGGDYGFLTGDTPLNKLNGKRILAACCLEKAQAVVDLIESSDDRWIVFYNYDEELHFILTELDRTYIKRPLSIVNGKKQDLTNHYKEKNSVTFVQYSAGAHALNLQLANQIIFASPTISAELYTQSIGRIRRLGQEQICFFHRVIMENSVEGDMLSYVSKGVDYNEKLFLASEEGGMI